MGSAENGRDGVRVTVYRTGETDQVGDCGRFEAGIHVDDWMQRIVAYGKTPRDAEALRDLLLEAISGIAQPNRYASVEYCKGLEQERDFLKADRDRWAKRWDGAIRRGAALEQEPPKRLIGWRTENYLHETADPDVARNWEPNIGVLPVFEGDPNTRLAGGERQ